jgi:antitoxin (DNA-binding transcriptional repressor) of toxin-antitoxin stability system
MLDTTLTQLRKNTQFLFDAIEHGDSVRIYRKSQPIAHIVPVGKSVMSELILVSDGRREIKPIIEAALKNERRLIRAGLQKTEQNLKGFEKKYNMNTEKFISDYEKDKLEEKIDFIEWIGEFRMLERLIDKLETMKSIRFEN